MKAVKRRGKDGKKKKPPLPHGSPRNLHSLSRFLSLPLSMSAAVRSRAAGTAVAVQSVYVFSRRIHASRISDVHRKYRRRWWDDFWDRDRDRDPAPRCFRPVEPVSLGGHLVDRGALVPSTPWQETTVRYSGEPPEIWQQPGVSGVTADSASLGRINVIRVGGGGEGGSGAGGGGGGFGSEDAYWGGSSLPIPKEICRGLDKFVVGQERAKKVNFGAFDIITGFVGRVLV